MTNYKELIERLRDPNNCNVLDDVDEAADAIETLTAELAEERHRHDRLQDWDRGHDREAGICGAAMRAGQ